MEPNSIMVDEQLDDLATDDTLHDEVVEEPDESESLESLMNEGESEPTVDEPQEQTPQASEPGWIKKRVEKAVNKAIEQTRADMQAMFDKQMAPLREKLLNDEARELVQQGEFKSFERAKEYLQMKQGLPVQPTQEPKPEQPRQSNGQYAVKNDPILDERVRVLKYQANKIKAKDGIDVMAEYNNNPEIQDKVFRGEMDFYDVADYLREQKPSSKKPPAPMRSPNGASVQNPNAIMNMTDEQFERMERNIKERGARYELR